LATGITPTTKYKLLGWLFFNNKNDFSRLAGETVDAGTTISPFKAGGAGGISIATGASKAPLTAPAT
jgi:hypothetical protein